LRGEKAAGCVGVWQHSTRAREDETRETPKLELPTATSVTTYVKSAVESARALDRGAVGENFRDPSARKVGSIRNRALIGRFESVRQFQNRFRRIHHFANAPAIGSNRFVSTLVMTLFNSRNVDLI
jgi:hypothetical protein